MQERIENLQADLELFSDELEKYEYIIDLGKSLPNLEEEHKRSENLVQGCTSKVWLVCKKEQNNLVFLADSDAVIVRGLVKMMIDIFSHQSPQAILDFDVNLLEKLGLSEIITPSRQNGVQGMLKRIKEYASAM